MQVTLNGAMQEVAPGTTVRDIVSRHTGRTITDSAAPADGRSLAIAVAVDGAVLRRSDWVSTPVTEGASVDIVTAVQGG